MKKRWIYDKKWTPQLKKSSVFDDRAPAFNYMIIIKFSLR